MTGTCFLEVILLALHLDADGLSCQGICPRSTARALVNLVSCLPVISMALFSFLMSPLTSLLLTWVQCGEKNSVCLICLVLQKSFPPLRRNVCSALALQGGKMGGSMVFLSVLTNCLSSRVSVISSQMPGDLRPLSSWARPAAPGRSPPIPYSQHALCLDLCLKII